MNAPSIYGVLALAVVLRVGFFLYGLYQDTHMTVKYTDIDYLVFSDAAKYVHQGQSPYHRETYRYTPLLSWLVLPNAWGGYWYNFGKYVFMISDLFTGIIIIELLKSVKDKSGARLSEVKLSILSSLWLLNPMVITISTRGSSESVLTVMIMLSLYFLLIKKSLWMSAIWLGLSIHFKIYPIIYLPSIMYYLSTDNSRSFINLPVLRWLNVSNLKYLIIALLTMGIINGIMYELYGYEFVYHSYLYHLTRLDHRHNFSVFNVVLYYKSALQDHFSDLENFILIPQMTLSAVLIPLLFADTDLISSIFIQTFAFVTFNKVMTSQYSLWFLIFLPHYLARSRYLTNEHCWKGIGMLVAWVASQAAWLNYAYKLEFLGQSTFDHGLLYSAIALYLVNCEMLVQFIDDTATPQLM